MQWGIPQNIARIDRGSQKEGKDPQNGRFHALDARVVPEVAVDDETYAGHRELQHRPHESPANPRFMGGAGDVVSVLLDLVIGSIG